MPFTKKKTTKVTGVRDDTPIERAAKQIAAARRKANIATNDSDQDDAQITNETMPRKRVTRSSGLLATGNTALGELEVSKEPTHGTKSAGQNGDVRCGDPAVSSDGTGAPATVKKGSGSAKMKAIQDKDVSSDDGGRSDSSSEKLTGRELGSGGTDKAHNYDRGIGDKLRELERKLKDSEGQ
jgi:hypothetical protein